MNKKKYVEVKAYLNPEKDKALIETLQRIADKTGMTMSAVCGVLLRNGAGSLEKALSGSKVQPTKPKKKAVQG